MAAALLCAGVGAGWWAAQSTVTGPNSEPAQQPSTVTAVVAEATVGRALDLSVTVEQPTQVLAVNLLPGVVTGTAALDGPVTVGTTLYSVAGVPVRVVPGDVPFYRDLEAGTAGPDVTQLQAALRALGFTDRAPTGRFDVATMTAVRTWQDNLGQPRNGRVALGELVAAPALPTQVRLGDDIQVGALLTSGEEAVLATTGERIFTLVLDRVQARAVPTTAAIEATWQQNTWQATIASSSINEEGYTVLTLTGPDGAAVCADQCNTLPPDPQLTLPSRVVIEPPVSGPGVPAAAIRTTAEGHSYVVLDDGTEHDVQVLGSSRGVVVIDGISNGDTVRLPDGP